MKKKFLSIFLSLTVILASLPMIAGASASSPNGDGVNVTESVQKVSGTDNEYKVNFTVAGGEAVINNNADIVLVIDRSSDMNKYANNIKTAACNFAKQVLTGKNSGNKMAVVSFGSDSKTNIELSNNEANVEKAINGISFPFAFEGTYTQKGLHDADVLLQKSSAKHKIIVLLSNGKPTYSATPIFGNLQCTCYPATATTLLGKKYTYCGDHSWNNDETITGFDYGNRQGFLGLSWVTDYSETIKSDCKYYDIRKNLLDTTKHSYSIKKSFDQIALADVNFGKAKGYTYYSIGYELGWFDKVFGKAAESEAFLKAAATGSNYKEATKDSLDGVLEGFGTTIEQTAKRAELAIPLENGVDLVTKGGTFSAADDCSVSQGTITYDSVNRKFIWQLGNVDSKKPATLSYNVKLNIETYRFDKSKTYPVNSADHTVLTYADSKKLIVSVPTVAPAYATLSQRGYLVNSEGTPINSKGEEVKKEEAVVVNSSSEMINSANGGNQWAFGDHAVTASDVFGYSVYGNNTQSVAVSADSPNGEVWFPYTLKDQSYQVEQYFEDLNGGYSTNSAYGKTDKIKLNETKNAADFVLTSIPGFTYDETNSNSVKSISYTESGKTGYTLKLYYKRSTYKLTIHYKYSADNSEAYKDYTGEYKYEQPIDVTNPIIENYETASQSVTGTMGASDKEVTVLYAKGNHSLTVNYVDEHGEPIQTPYKQNYDSGNTYTVTSPVIPGYELKDSTKSTITGTMGDSDQSVNFVYTQKIHTLTINYVAEDKTKISDQAQDVIKTDCHYNDYYNYSSPPVTGYTPDKSAVFGNMPDEDVTVTVTYKINSYKRTVLFIAVDGDAQHQISKVELTLNYGDKYDAVDSPSVTGYTPNRKKIDGGSMPDHDVIDKVYYTANPHNLTIHYTMPDGSAAFNDYTATVLYGRSYHVESNPLTHYAPDKDIVDGTMPDNDVVVDVIYKPLNYNVVIHYQDSEKNKIQDDGSASAPYGSDFTKNPDFIEGYTAKSLPQTIPISDDNNEITFLYEKNPILTVNYVFDGSGSTITNKLNTYAKGTKIDLEKLLTNAQLTDFKDYKYSSVEWGKDGINDAHQIIGDAQITLHYVKSSTPASSTDTPSTNTPSTNTPSANTTPSSEVIDDSSVPLTSGPASSSSSSSSSAASTETISDDSTPLASAPQTSQKPKPSSTTQINDDGTPLAAPATGDNGLIPVGFTLLAAVSLTGIVVLKRKGNKNQGAE